MTNYIILHNGTEEHYFFKPYEGLCFRQKKKVAWQEYQVLYRDCLDHFGVYMDESETIHILCANTAGELVYLLYRGEEWHKYVLAKLPEGLKTGRIKLSPAGGRLNLLYSASYNNEDLLVHCILGNNAQPATIDKLSGDEFFLSGERVYYTNGAGVLGYQDLSDGKPEQFHAICEGAVSPYILQAGEMRFMTYKKGDAIYFQNEPVYEYRYAEDPILVLNENRLMLLWKDGGFIRYLTSLNFGKTWSTPMQFVNPGKSAELYYVQKNNAICHYYGNHSASELHIFGTNHLFAPQQYAAADKKPQQSAPPENTELTKLKILLDMTHNEIETVKKELSALKRELQSLEKQIPPQSSEE